VTSLPMPPRVYVSLGKAFDVQWAKAGLRRSWGDALMSPDQRFDIHIDYNRVVDVARFWDKRDIERSETWIATGERGFTVSGWRLGSNLRLASSAGLSNMPAAGMRNFLRAEIEERAYFRFNRKVRINLRGIIGHLKGDAPAQEQYFLSGGFKTAGFEDMIISYKGWWSAQERYHVEGGADLPGYAGHHLRGTKVAALNLSLPVYRTPISLFVGVGQVVDDWSEYTWKSVAANAGLDLRLPGVRLLLPLWINRPELGKKRFDWRWKVSISGSVTIG